MGGNSQDVSGEQQLQEETEAGGHPRLALLLRGTARHRTVVVVLAVVTVVVEGRLAEVLWLSCRGLSWPAWVVAS